MSVYERYFTKGLDDKASGGKCDRPDSITENFAFRGYMDGWSGRDFKEPKGMPVVNEFKNYAEGGNDDNM